MAYPVIITFPRHYRGDRWPGIKKIGPVLVNGATPPDSLVRVRLYFRNSNGEFFRLDSDPAASPDAPITIDNANTWEASIPEVQSFVDRSGEWEWDMEFYSAGKAGPMTLYRGILSVRNDITR